LAIPLSRVTLNNPRLPGRKVAALLVVTLDALRAPMADEALRVDLLRAVTEATDAAFLAWSNTDDGARPGGIAYGAAEIVSTGDLGDDLADAIEAFTGDLNTATWVMHPRTAAMIALRLGGVGIASDLGARGGSLLGLPV